MANYKETTVAGSSYVRASGVTITNGEANKNIYFDEEKVINLGDGDVIRKPAGRVGSPFSIENAGTAFPLLNPETGDPIVDGAQMTYEGVYAALYSLYIHLAKERDAALAQEDSPAE